MDADGSRRERNGASGVMAGEKRTVTCARCGRTFLSPIGFAVAGEFVCPTCRDKPAAAEQQPPAPGPTAAPSPAGDLGEEMVSVCPVCGAGKVHRKRTDPNEHSLVCTNCASMIEESMLGYRYVRIDARDQRVLDGFEGKTFTLPELQRLAAEKQAARKARESAPTPEPRLQPEQPEEEEPKGAAGGEEDGLMWMIDHEAQRRREEQQRAAKQKSVTVDDLMQEIEKKQE